MAVMDTIKRIVLGPERDYIEEDYGYSKGRFDESESIDDFIHERDEFEDDREYGNFSFGNLFRGGSGRTGSSRRSNRVGSPDMDIPEVDDEPMERSYGGRSYSSYASEKRYERRDAARIVLVRATRFSEVKRIAENLKQNRSIVVNFEDVDKHEAQRIMDFLSGTIFAQNGKVQKLSSSTYIFAVGSVDLVGSIEKVAAAEEYFMNR